MSRTLQDQALELYYLHPPRLRPGIQGAVFYSLLSLDQAFNLMTPSSSSQLAPFHPDSHFISLKEVYFPNDSARAQCSILGPCPLILLVSLKITGKQAIFKKKTVLESLVLMPLKQTFSQHVTHGTEPSSACARIKSLSKYKALPVVIASIE